MARLASEEGDNLEMEFEEPDPELAKAKSEAYELTELTVISLNILRFLLNSNTFFSEVTKQASLIEDLMKLLSGKNSLVALLSALVLRATIHYARPNVLSNIERENKRWLLIQGGLSGPGSLNSSILDSSKQADRHSKPCSGDLLTIILKNLTDFELAFDECN